MYKFYSTKNFNQKFVLLADAIGLVDSDTMRFNVNLGEYLESLLNDDPAFLNYNRWSFEPCNNLNILTRN